MTSGKKSKFKRQREKEQKALEEEGKKIAFTIKINVHNNGRITVENLPNDILYLVKILTDTIMLGISHLQKMPEKPIGLEQKPISALEVTQ